MQKINLDTGLRGAILQLEGRQADEGEMLKEECQLVIQSIKPINLIRNSFKEVATSKNLRDDILSTSVGLAAGYLSKKLFESVSHRPLKRLFGTALLFGITNVVAKNPEAVKSVGKWFISMIVCKFGRRAKIYQTDAYEAAS